MPKYFCRLKMLGLFLPLLIFSITISSCTSTEAVPKARHDTVQMREIDVDAAALPDVSANAAIGIESTNGEIFYSKNIDERLPMASTTKIMTAVIALECGNLADKVVIDKDAVGVEGSSIYLYENEVLTLENLLYALMLESANDAAAAIAIHIGGSIEDFVQMMNDKAQDLGLTSTHFDNPHGLDGKTHYTTARELGIIASYAMKNEDFRKITSTYKTTIPLSGGEGTRVLINHNKLLRNFEGTVGIKTGYTKKSGRCLVSAISRDGVELICVTLSAPSDWQDHESILNFGLSLYENKMLADIGEISAQIPVIGGQITEIDIQNTEEIYAVVRRGSEIDTVIEAPRFIFAPIQKGQIIGRVVFIQDGSIIAEAPLTAAQGTAIQKRDGLFSIFKK